MFGSIVENWKCRRRTFHKK